jgi:phage repressor protein C with HTH and peptisase S24 domain
MHTIDDKITAIVKRFNLNNYAFSKQIGVTGTTIDSILNGRPQKDGSRKKTKPGYDVLLAIINTFEINPDYLFGKSTIMLRSEIKTFTSISHGHQNALTLAASEEEGEHFVYISVESRADYLKRYSDVDYITSLPSFKLPFLTHGKFRCFEVHGNSMAPTFFNSDFVLGTAIETVSDIKNDEIYVIISETYGVIVKRVLNHVELHQKLVLKSDNEDGNFPDFIINVDEIKEVWKVISYLSKEIPKPMNMLERLHELERKIVNIEQKIH